MIRLGGRWFVSFDDVETFFAETIAKAQEGGQPITLNISSPGPDGAQLAIVVVAGAHAVRLVTEALITVSRGTGGNIHDHRARGEA